MEPLEEDRIWPQSRSSKLPQYLATFGGTLVAFSAGTCWAWFEFAFNTVLENTEDVTFRVIVIRLLLLAPVLGALLAWLMLQWCGRRGTLMVLSVPMIASYALVLALRTNFVLLCIARVLGGIAEGGVFVAAPIYISEVAEDSIRGQLGSLFLVMFCGGTLFVRVLGLAGSYVAVNACCLVVPLLACAVLYWMPETPHHHLAHNRKQLARNALQWLRGEHYDVSQELDSLQAYMDEAMWVDGTCRNLVRPVASRALFTSLGLITFQVLCSVTAIDFVVTRFFHRIGNELTFSTYIIILSAAMVVTLYLGSHLVDRLGRRVMLLISGSILMLSMSVLFVSHLIEEPSDSWVPLNAGWLFLVGWCFGFWPLPWTFMAELLPPRAKGLGACLAVCLYWMLIFISSISHDTMYALLYLRFIFLIFAATCLLATLFVYFFVPETKGKSLRQIQEELAKRKTCLL